MCHKKVFITGIMGQDGSYLFVHSYVLKLGFLDGRAGLHFAVSRAFYYWQIGIKIKEVNGKNTNE